MVDPLFGYAQQNLRGRSPIKRYHQNKSSGLDLECVNVHDGSRYKMVNCRENTNVSHDVVFPSQFARLLVEYQEHPEAKSLAPNGTPCQPNTNGLLQRAHVIAGEIRYVGKETDRKWEGDDISILEFAATEYGRSARVIAREEMKNKILEIGINKCARESGFDRKNFIRKLIREIPVKRNSCSEFLRWLQSYELAK